MTSKNRRVKKKAGTAGRFGARYGKKIRENVRKSESKSKKKYPCPRCGKPSVKRSNYSVWKCSKCGMEFAGGAYTPQTEVGKVAQRVVLTGEKADKAAAELEELEED